MINDANFLLASPPSQVQEPEFEGQTKGKLGNSEVKGLTESVVAEQLGHFFDENPQMTSAA